MKLFEDKTRTQTQVSKTGEISIIILTIILKSKLRKLENC